MAKVIEEKAYLLLKLASYIMPTACFVTALVCYVMHDYNSAIFFGISAIYMQREQMMLEN